MHASICRPTHGDPAQHGHGLRPHQAQSRSIAGPCGPLRDEHDSSGDAGEQDQRSDLSAEVEAAPRRRLVPKIPEGGAERFRQDERRPKRIVCETFVQKYSAATSRGPVAVMLWTDMLPSTRRHPVATGFAECRRKNLDDAEAEGHRRHFADGVVAVAEVVVRHRCRSWRSGRWRTWKWALPRLHVELDAAA